MNRTHLSAAIAVPTGNAARRLCESGILVIGALATILLLTPVPAAAHAPSQSTAARLFDPPMEPVIRPRPRPFPDLPRPPQGPRCNGRPC